MKPAARSGPVVRSLSLWSTLALIAPQAGCSSPTELVVVVDTDLAIPSEIDRVEVSVTGPGGATRAEGEDLRDRSELPLTLGVRPAGEVLGPVEVVARGLSNGVEVVDRRALVTLVAGERRVLVMHLVSDCVGRDCPQTCGQSGCVPFEVGELPEWTGEPPRLGMDSGAPSFDAGGRDAGPERQDAGALDAAARDATAAHDGGGEADAAMADAGRDGGTDSGPTPDCEDHADCDDGRFCNGAERCLGGRCEAGTEPSCSDGVACTVDSCSESDGACVQSPNHGLCTDGAGGSCDATTGCQYLLCTESSCRPGPCQEAHCNGGTCIRTSLCASDEVCCAGSCVPAGCDDDNPCTDDSCDASAGCVHVEHTRSCDDANPCTIDETCSGGVCQGGVIRSCDDANDCTEDSCHLTTGCVHDSRDGMSCNDGDACTTSDTCAGTSCSGSPRLCSDRNPCTEDSCDPAVGCVYDPGPVEGEECDDGDMCTGPDTCTAGDCGGLQQVLCPRGCTCHPDTGACLDEDGSMFCLEPQ